MPLPRVHLRLIVLAFAALAVASVLVAPRAHAQSASDTSTPWTDWATEAAAPDWRTWVAMDAGFALRLPPGHELAAAGDGLWYLLGGGGSEATVPDATLRWLPNADLRGALRDTYEAAAIAEPWIFGDEAAVGLRVLSVRDAPDGTPYTQAGYLIELDRGVLRVSRYEGFDWAPFHAVAQSVVRVRTPNGGGE